jgi:hypothetical protein
VNVFDEDYGQEVAAALVVAGDLPIHWERVFTLEELETDPEISWAPERVLEF